MYREITRSLDKYFIVSHQPLFHSLTESEKIFVANRCQIVEYNKNDLVYSKGQVKDYLYIIITGRVLLFYPESKPHRRKAKSVEVLMKGDYFGLISVLTGKPHSLSARILNDASFIRIDARAMKQILAKIPSLAMQFNRTLTRRYREKDPGRKEVFQSTILSVYYNGDEDYTSNYAGLLGESIRKETGKKVTILSVNKHLSDEVKKKFNTKYIFMNNPSKIIPIVSNLACDYHFVILDLPKKIESVEETLLKQSDVCHIICDGEFADVKEGIGLAGSLGKTEEVRLLLREGKNKVRPLENECKGLMAFTLPFNKQEFKKTTGSIARFTSGKALGLALGAGGALGMAQIGILDALSKNGVNVDIVAGTSMGSIVASFWAAGYSAKEIEKIFSEFDTKSSNIKLLDVIIPRQGLIGGRNIRQFLTKFLGDMTFADTKIPLRVVACDIKTRNEEVISHGKVVDAIMASIAIPGIFNPVATKDGKLLVDGGVVCPIPISVLSGEGVKRIIAVNSMPSPEDSMKVSGPEYTIFDIIVNSFYSMEYRIGKYAAEEADVYFHPVLKGAAWYEFFRLKEFVKLGREKAAEVMDDIRKLAE